MKRIPFGHCFALDGRIQAWGSPMGGECAHVLSEQELGISKGDSYDDETLALLVPARIRMSKVTDSQISRKSL